MDLKTEIAKIVKLQKTDSEIHALCKEKDIKLPEEFEKLRLDFQEKEKNLESAEKEGKGLQLMRKNKELDLATKEEAVKKAQGHLYQLKTNKEYQAKLTEIASLKADVSVLEEDVLKILDSIEGQESKLKNARENLLIEEKKFKEEESKIQTRIKEIEGAIGALETKRAVLANDVNMNILVKYEKLLKTRSGVAVATADDESCGACNIRVTAQTINEIKMYKDLIFCENCVRILYISEDIS